MGSVCEPMVQVPCACSTFPWDFNDESETEHKLENFRMVICEHEGPPHPGSSPDLRWGLKKPRIGLGK